MTESLVIGQCRDCGADLEDYSTVCSGCVPGGQNEKQGQSSKKARSGSSITEEVDARE
jgi:hypothetical protein